MERQEPQALAAIQHQLWRLITEPSGVEAALAANGDDAGAQLVALIRGDRGLAPVDRVAVYANAYFARIHDCLREDFGALAGVLGPDAFHDLVKTYLMMHAPTRASLRHVGEHLVEHLATEPFAEIFSRRCPYGADLARLEWAMTQAFYARDATVVTREDLGAVASGSWRRLRFAPVPSLRLVALAWPVHTVRERFDQERVEVAWAEAPALTAETTYLRVWRLDERVRYRAMARREHDALVAAQAGEPFAAICELLASTAPEAEAARRAATLLASWVRDGLLARVL